MMSAPAAIVRIGTDRVCVTPERVVIETSTPMDWPVREYCRVPIYYEGRRFFLKGASETKSPRSWRYELCPWPTDLHDASSRVAFYDHDYVAERDVAYRMHRRQERMHFLFVPFYPLLGLIWSEWKHGWFSRVGFEPRSVTSASVALVFNLFIVEGMFVGWLQGGLLVWLLADGRLRPADLLLTLLLAADCFMRYGQLLKTEVPRYWGFCEWLLPRRWRAPAGD